MQYEYQIYRLSDKFYADYPYKLYPEILYKKQRPYNCILVDINTDYFICLPFRTNINHSNCYHFKRSRRSKAARSGIDYSKMVIITDLDYMEDNAVVDSDEYREMVENIDRIVREAVDYLMGYIGHKKGTRVLHSREYSRKYSRSSLPYFDPVLLNKELIKV